MRSPAGLIVAVALAFLAGCAQQSSAPDNSGAPTTEAPAEAPAPEPEAPAPTDPIPEPQPEPAPAPVTEAPAPEAPAAAEGEPPATAGLPEESIEAGAGAPPEPPTRSLAQKKSAIKIAPVIVELQRSQPRRPANGGSSVILFSDVVTVAARNRTTCTQIWSLMDTATVSEVRVGVRRDSAGNVEALRPLYWMVRAPAASTAKENCDQRLARYDYARAKTLRQKLGLTTAGPFLVVSRTDERVASVIDLTSRSDQDVKDLVRYFRDGFAFRGDIWDPSLARPETRKASLVAVLGGSVRDSLVGAIAFITKPVQAATSGCVLGDLTDAPCR